MVFKTQLLLQMLGDNSRNYSQEQMDAIQNTAISTNASAFQQRHQLEQLQMVFKTQLLLQMLQR
jgi:hypothetical protein